MTSTVRDRIGAATGGLFVVLILIGNGLDTAGTSTSAHPNGQQVLADVVARHDSTAATVGLFLELLGFASFVVFLGWLADVLRRRTRTTERIAAVTAVVAGVVMLAIKLGSAAPAVVLDLNRVTLPPDLAQALNDMNGAAFVVSWLPFALLVGALAVALRQAGLVGRPTAAVGYVLGVAGVALALFGLRDVVGANPLAFLLGLLWLVAVSVRLAVRPGQDRAPEVAPVGDPLPANA